MLNSQIPTRIPLPFANSGTKNFIPTASQIGITPGAASLTDGFPPLNGTPKAAGGIAPTMQDFNGILNLVTAVQQWQCAGGIFKYDAAFSAAIGGYPQGAVLIGATGIQYLNLVDNNTTNPESAGVNWGSLQTATPPQFDATTKIATMAAVKQAGLRGSGQNVFAASGNITAAMAGSAIYNNVASTTLTLPNPTSLPVGEGYVIVANQATTITCSAGNFVQTGISSFVMPKGFVIYIQSDSVNWNILWRTGSDGALVAGNGYKQGPYGEIDQWSYAVTGTTAAGVILVPLPIAFPNNFLSGIACSANGNSVTNVGMGGASTATKAQVYFAANTTGVFVRVVGN